MLITTLMLLVVFAATIVKGEGTAQIWTDKADYVPEDTVTIFGTGFLPESTVTVEVTRPDLTVDSWSDVVSDESGGFTTAYLLDGITGIYTVTATDGTNTATTTFTDVVYRKFSATISPTSALAGETKTYTVTITRDASSTVNQNIGSATISIPSGFTSIVFSGGTNPVASSGKSWTKAIVSGVIRLVASTGTDKLVGTESVSVSFSATAPSPSTDTQYVWTTNAYAGVTPPFETPFDIVGDQPIVTVTAGFVSFKVSGVKSEYGKSPLSGWTIQLYKDEDEDPYASAVTGTTPWATGYYEFTITEPGDYAIFEVLKAGWTAVSPTLQIGDPANTMEVEGYSFTATSGQADITNQNFVNFEWATVAGTKTEYDGSGLEGWTIKAVGPSTYSAVTDENGNFLITVKRPGTYAIKEVLKAGWTMTTPSLHVGSGSDEDVTGYSGVSIGSGDIVTGEDFENFEWLTISGYKHDTEGVALEGWDMELYDSNGLYASDTTDSIGYYEFTVKDPGTYSIKEVLKDRWTETSPVLTYSLGDSVDRSVLGYSGITVSSGTDVTGKDFENFQWMIISGVKFFDADGDGTKDSGEPGLQYWDIKLYKDSTLYGSTTSASDGSYSFTVKDPGTYSIKEVLKAHWIETTPISTGPFDASQEVLGHSDITVESGVNIPDKDFGNWLGSSSFVTTSGLCYFDVDNDPTNGRQFKLIFTPDVPAYPNLYRLTASNPGQFYYNIFYVGDLSIDDSFTITLPYPFVTQGANPVHVYSSLNTGPCGCLIPQGDISGSFSVFKTAITLTDYTDTNGDGKIGFGDTVTLTITCTDTASYTGFAYINIHLDYGLKKNIGGLTQSSKTPPCDATGPSSIYDDQSYTFSVAGPDSFTSEDSVKNMNVFKRDPGFVGQVTDSEGAPVAGVKVQIYGPDGKLLATVYTDEDGWYMYNYKYTGKAATFTVKLPDYKLQQSVILKANSFVVVNFQI